MGLFNFRKLLARKTKKSKPTKSSSKKGKKASTKSKTNKRTRPVASKKGKKTQRRRSGANKKGRKGQRGAGGNYRLDVAKDCKIGGLPAVSPVNECPKGVGPADPAFGTAIYTHPVVGGGRTKKAKSRQSRLKRRSRK